MSDVKWVFITGASRGVGEQLAMAFGKLEGYKLILHARSKANLSKVQQIIENNNTEVHLVEAELSSHSAVDAMLDRVESIAPQIDIVYNNAAIMTTYRDDFWSFPVDEFETSFAVNVITLARICQRLAPGMLERNYGRIINVSSGIANEPELTPYAISKAAVDKYVADLACKFEGTNVTMNLLDPGWLRTDLGGPNADNAVESVVPGAMLPGLIEKPVNGVLFGAQDYSGLSLEEALSKYASRS